MANNRKNLTIEAIEEVVKTSEKQLTTEEVAEILNVSHRTLLRRCKEYGGYREIVKRVNGAFHTRKKYNPSESLKVSDCRHCGTVFEGHFNQVFCSEHCKKEYNKTPKTCPTCGKQFFAFGRTIFCSDECAITDKGACVVCGTEYSKSIRDRSSRRAAPTCSAKCSNIYFLSKSGRVVTVDDVERAVSQFDGQPTAFEIADILNSTYVKVVQLAGERYDSFKELVRFIKGEYRKYSTNSVPKVPDTARKHECLYCGSEFESHYNSRYCSERCKDKAKLEKIVDTRDCTKCGDPFDVQYKFRNDLMCPKCKPPISKEATALFDLLDEMGFGGAREQTFEGMVNPKTGAHLRVDYYIDWLPLAIEYNGIQHYTEQHFFHSKRENEFENSQMRDKIKRDYLLSKGIPLVIWRYDEPVTKEKVAEKFERFLMQH